MKTVVMLTGLMLLMGFAAQGQEGGGVLLDTNFYVAGVSDWNGTLTVQVLNALDYVQFKKNIDLDNKAFPIAFQNIKLDWKEKYAPPSTTEPGLKIPSFPLKRPLPRVCRFFGKLPTVEAAEARKTFYEERETGRQKRLEAETERALTLLPEAKQSTRADKAVSEAELMEQLVAEIETVKMALSMGEDPHRKRDRTQSNTSSTGGKTITFKQGARLGEGGGEFVKGGSLVDDGPLGKKRTEP